MQPLSALDALFLHLETDETPMHVGALHLLKPPAGHSGDFAPAVREHVADRMPYAPVLTRRLRSLPLGFANPVWETVRNVDLERHVQSVRLRRPGTHAQLLSEVARLHARRLEPGEPPWMFYLFDGLRSGQLAFYTKFHHAALDGAAAVALAQALLDPGPVPRPMPPRAIPRARRTTLVSLLGTSLRSNTEQVARIAGRLPDAARVIVALLQNAPKFRFAPRTPLNLAIGAERRIATLSIPMATIRTISAAHHATINDVVLAIVSGALRRYFEAAGGLPGQSLVAAMPVSLREAGDERPTTLATMTLAELATDVADPAARLRAIQTHTRAAKGLAQRLRSVMPTDFPSLGLPWLLSAAAQLYGRSRLADRLPPIANLVISNVPGPDVPLYLAGARLETWWPLSIVEHGLGLNVTVQSYAGALHLGLVAAASSIADLEPLARAITASVRELQPRAAAGARRRPSKPRREK